MLKDYIVLGYKPTKQDFVCEYHIEPAQGNKIYFLQDNEKQHTGL